MKYRSTRGGETGISASQAILQGIAQDGGLFVPDEIPRLEKSLSLLMNLSYQELAYEILKLYLTDYEETELKHCITCAYGGTFRSQDVTPLVKKQDDLFFLELFHGKTLAFKDVALSLLPHLMKTAASKNQMKKGILILTATSGDTGKAALEAFQDVEGTQIIVLYPENGVSLMQEMQMVTQEGANTTVLAIKGNFDDAQSAVKRVFLDDEIKKTLLQKGYMLSSANSINIGRLVPQIVYYFYAYLCLLRQNEIAPDDKVNFVVPTGNFGNILAGYYAKEMGLPVGKLICASNENNVLYDFFRTKIYDKNRALKQTAAPSIDILISSNLERLLYDVSKDATLIKTLMNHLDSKGKYDFQGEMGSFYGYYTDEEEMAAAIHSVYERLGYLMDTHTAVAYCAYEKDKAKREGGNKDGEEQGKTVILSTASPYKFTKAVMGAVDSQYKQPVWDDFALIREMEKLTKDKTVADYLVGLSSKERRHTGLIKPDGLKDKVLEITRN